MDQCTSCAKQEILNGRQQQLSPQGRPTTHANPWLKQLWEDLATATAKGTEIAELPEEEGWMGLYKIRFFFNFDPKSLRELETTYPEQA